MSTPTKRKTVKRRKLIEQNKSDAAKWSLWQELDPVMIITAITVIVATVGAPLFLMAVLKGLTT